MTLHLRPGVSSGCPHPESRNLSLLDQGWVEVGSLSPEVDFYGWRVGKTGEPWVWVDTSGDALETRTEASI